MKLQFFFYKFLLYVQYFLIVAVVVACLIFSAAGLAEPKFNTFEMLLIGSPYKFGIAKRHKSCCVEK